MFFETYMLFYLWHRLNEVWTSVSHDSVSDAAVSSCEPSFCHKHNVIYAATMEQIEALIEISEGCRQYIKVWLLARYGIY